MAEPQVKLHLSRFDVVLAYLALDRRRFALSAPGQSAVDRLEVLFQGALAGEGLPVALAAPRPLVRSLTLSVVLRYVFVQVVLPQVDLGADGTLEPGVSVVGALGVQAELVGAVERLAADRATRALICAKEFSFEISLMICSFT